MTEILNGNRFLYIKPLKEGQYLLRTCTCAGITCSLYHKGQPLSVLLNAQNVGALITLLTSVRAISAVKFAKKQDICLGKNMWILHRGGSNHNPLSVVKTILFPIFTRWTSKSLEYCTNLPSMPTSTYVKAMRSGDVPRATAIQEAPSALDAKLISNKVLPSEISLIPNTTLWRRSLKQRCPNVESFMTSWKMLPLKRSSSNPRTTTSGVRDST